jgi:hypothetical protein
MPEPERTPDSGLAPPVVLIGQDRLKRWVVRDPRGLIGGLFVSREEAVRFAMFETGCGPLAAVMIPDVLELDIEPPDTAPARRPILRAA